MDIPYELNCPHTNILSFLTKSLCLGCYMKRLSFLYSSSTNHPKMRVKELLLSSIFQVVFDKLVSGLISATHAKIKNWSQRLSSIQAQIKDDAGETQWLTSAMDLACEVTDLLDEMSLFPGSEDLKETTRKILAYECVPSISSTYGTQEEEHNIQLPPTHRGKSRKWKKKHRPRKYDQWKPIKWKKKHPRKHKKDERTRNMPVPDITGSSTVTKENHDQLIHSLANPLASRIAAWMTEYCKELQEEKAPTQKHEHIHNEESSPIHEGEGVKTSEQLNIDPRTSATLHSTLRKITEQQTYMCRRLVGLEKKLDQVLNCVEKWDAAPLCAQDRKRQHAPKLPPAKRRKTQDPEVAKDPHILPVCNVPSTPVVDATSNSPNLFFCSFLL